MLERDLKVLGGLPVTVRFEVEPVDYSSGIYQPEINGFDVVAVCGKSLKRNNWVERRLVTSGEYSCLEQQLLELI